jgi:hypothetical protein
MQAGSELGVVAADWKLRGNSYKAISAITTTLTSKHCRNSQMKEIVRLQISLDITSVCLSFVV